MLAGTATGTRAKTRRNEVRGESKGNKTSWAGVQDGPKSESDLKELNSRWTEVRGGHTEHTLCALHEAKSKSKLRDQAEVTRNRK